MKAPLRFQQQLTPVTLPEILPIRGHLLHTTLACLRAPLAKCLDTAKHG